MNYLKTPAFRSESYRRYVASQECFGCGIVGFSQCAHEEFGKGKGIKSDDRRSFPLCCDRFGMIGCHTQHTLLIDMTRDDRRELEGKYVAKMQARAREDGRKELMEAA